MDNRLYYQVLIIQAKINTNKREPYDKTKTY